MTTILDSPIKYVHNLENGCSFEKDHTEWRYKIFPEMIWRFQLNMLSPLMIELESGATIMPNYEYTTNLGSIPLPLRPIFPKDEFPICYALHDDEYNRHGVYVRYPYTKVFVFVRTDRAGADRRLRSNILTIGEGSVSRANCVYGGVRIGGGLPWAMGAVRERKLEGLKLC